MISNKISNKKAITLATLFASTICINSLSAITSVPSAVAQYGLGLSRSAGTGGATRGNLPQITMIVPEDGAKTLASRPTFYWYIAPPSVATSRAFSDPKIEDDKISFKITFYLRDSNERSAKSIFVAEGKAEESGLYKFTLPENAPELPRGKLQRWQIRWQTNSGASQVDVNAPIRRDDNPAVTKEIASAKSDLEKARIYVKSTYWYDAIDAYTSWISKNPKDDQARTERNNLLKEGFKYHTAFSKEQEGNVLKLLTKLDESKNVITIALQPKILR